VKNKRILRAVVAILSVMLLAASAFAQETEMQTAEITKLQYGYERELPGVSYEDALEKVTTALQDKGFGILTEIDVTATMKKKLDKDYPNYKILGACNPVLADRALTADIYMGLLMPCNVVVREQENGTIAVSVMNPQVMGSMSDHPDLKAVADEAEALVKQVLESL
jgi:uncharacterized protein (DUF302 family)